MAISLKGQASSVPLQQGVRQQASSRNLFSISQTLWNSTPGNPRSSLDKSIKFAFRFPDSIPGGPQGHTALPPTFDEQTQTVTGIATRVKIEYSLKVDVWRRGMWSHKRCVHRPPHHSSTQNSYISSEQQPNYPHSVPTPNRSNSRPHAPTAEPFRHGRKTIWHRKRKLATGEPPHTSETVCGRRLVSLDSGAQREHQPEPTDSRRHHRLAPSTAHTPHMCALDPDPVDVPGPGRTTGVRRVLQGPLGPGVPPWSDSFDVKVTLVKHIHLHCTRPYPGCEWVNDQVLGEAVVRKMTVDIEHPKNALQPRVMTVIHACLTGGTERGETSPWGLDGFVSVEVRHFLAPCAGEH